MKKMRRKRGNEGYLAEWGEKGMQRKHTKGLTSGAMAEGREQGLMLEFAAIELERIKRLIF